MGTLTEKEFGTAGNGQTAFLYTLTNKNGMNISVTDYGAALVELTVLDKEDRPVDVVLGYDDSAAYEAGRCILRRTGWQKCKPHRRGLL